MAGWDALLFGLLTGAGAAGGMGPRRCSPSWAPVLWRRPSCSSPSSSSGSNASCWRACRTALGPNRVGPFGLLQTIADALKLVLKEVIVPSRGRQDRSTFWRPPLAVMSVVGLWGVDPVGAEPDRRRHQRRRDLPGLDRRHRHAGGDDGRLVVEQQVRACWAPSARWRC